MSPVTQRRLRIASAVFFGLATVAGWLNVILAGESGNRIQLAYQKSHTGPIEHGNGFWKLYLQTDDCKGLYKRCIDAGAESVTEPVALEHWPVIAAFVKDPDGYLVEILETHGESPAVSGPEA